VPAGAKDLLAGRLSCLFDVRRQCWRRIDVLRDAKANCQAHAKQLLADIKPGALLLFDLGYDNFFWFDGLTQAGFWWISRLRHNRSWKLMHVLLQRDGESSALVFLGAHRSDQSAYLVRLIRIRYPGRWYSWVTNVTDPLQMSGAEVARLYGRRWEIELGFRILKEHLGLRLLWSAKPQVTRAQIWALVTWGNCCIACSFRWRVGPEWMALTSRWNCCCDTLLACSSRLWLRERGWKNTSLRLDLPWGSSALAAEPVSRPPSSCGRRSSGRHPI